MKPLFTAAALAIALSCVPAAQAADGPVYRMTGCTKDNQTASTHIGVFGSGKNHDETRAVLNGHFAAAVKNFTGAETKTSAFDKAVEAAMESAKKELGPDVKVTGTFYSGLKPGCTTAVPQTPGENHP